MGQKMLEPGNARLQIETNIKKPRSGRYICIS